MDLEPHNKAAKLEGIEKSVRDFAFALGIKISPKGVSRILDALKSWKLNSKSETRLTRADFLKRQKLHSSEKTIINEMLDAGGFLILMSL